MDTILGKQQFQIPPRLSTLFNGQKCETRGLPKPLPFTPLHSPLSPSVHRPRKTGRFVGLQVSQFKCLHCLAATKLVWPLPKEQLLRCVNQQMSAERERERQREGKSERGERESVKCKLQVLSHTSTHSHTHSERPCRPELPTRVALNICLSASLPKFALPRAPFPPLTNQINTCICLYMQ